MTFEKHPTLQHIRSSRQGHPPAQSVAGGGVIIWDRGNRRRGYRDKNIVKLMHGVMDLIKLQLSLLTKIIKSERDGMLRSVSSGKSNATVRN